LQTIKLMIGMPIRTPRLRADRQHRHQDADVLIALKGKSRAHEKYMERSGASWPDEFPGSNLLFPAGGHRQPGAELRPLGSHRRGRSRSDAEQSFGSRASWSDASAGSRGRATCAFRRSWRTRPWRWTWIGAAAQIGVTERDVANTCRVAQLQLLGGAFVLDQPEEQRELPVVVQTPLRQIDSVLRSALRGAATRS